ncbi:MAG: putative toxin-antitoxin system toxin component, PIN family [Betaproteobacteria bacterium]|nr:putative toxin-antitoxin system toxin component, PIN family [Betaproteobacteria bacterium]
MRDLRLVVDTNVLISRLLSPRSVAARAVDLAIAEGRLLVSEATLSELARVLARPKFDRYVEIQDRQEFIRYLSTQVEVVTILQRFRACRDPKDDMFLDVAINGQASTIITGDADLLVLDPFMKIRIVTPAMWVDRSFQDRSK